MPKKKVEYRGDDEERIIYMPISTAQQIYGNNDFVDQINLTYNPKLDYNEVMNLKKQIQIKES